MPYKPFLEGGKQAVYAVDASGKKMGKRRGLHDTLAEAKVQIAAIMASEKKPKKEANTVTYTASSGEDAVISDLTVTVADSDDEALKDIHTKMGYYADPVPVAIIEAPVGPLTFADLMAEEAAREAAYEMHDLTDKFSRISRSIMASDVEDKAAALVALANEYADLVGSKIQEEMAEGKATTIAKQIAGDNQPESKETSTSQTTGQTSDSPNDPGGDSGKSTDTQSLFIWKENDTYRWIAAYSNNRRDDDNPPEIISSESHKEFDAALHKGEWPMPELWLWHIPYPVGVTQYHAYDESAGFPVAAGVFNKGCEWAAEGVMDAGWNGVSHGMPSGWIERSTSDPTVIIRHRTKEITFLPPWAAANKLAFNIINKESDMAEEKGLPSHKREEFIKAFGEEQVTKIETALEGKAKEADEAGIEKKEQDAPEPTEPVTGVTHKEIAEVLTVIKEMIEGMDSRIKALEEEKSTEQKEDTSFDLVALLKEKSAIGKPENKVDGRSTFAKDAPEEAQPESYTERFSGMRVSLVDQLVGANQAYYENRR